MNMKACYLVSFQGDGEVKKYFECFGHHMARVDQQPPSQENWCGICSGDRVGVQKGIHLMILAWYGKHFAEKG